MSNESLNKFQDAVTRTTAAIGVKTSVFVGSAKIKTHISTLAREINTMKQDLGAIVYEMWEKGESDPDQIAQQCQLIKEKHDSIKALEEDISKLERQETEVLGARKPEYGAVAQKMPSCVCPSCTSAFDVQVNFCRKCGTKMA